MGWGKLLAIVLFTLTAGGSTAPALGQSPADASANRFQADWSDPRVVAAGEIVFSDATSPPGDDAGWQPVALPDQWGARPRMTAHTAWYRFPVRFEALPQSPWGIYAWRYGMNLRIYVNDDLILDGGSFEEPVARNLHRPMLAHVPQSAWRQGDNYVYVHLRGFPNYGHLLPIGIGPYADFAEPYQKRYFFQIELSEYLFVITLLIAVIAAALWLVDRRNSAYAYFSAACLTWSLYSLNPFLQNLPFSNLVWLRLLHTSIDLFGFLLLMFLHRQLGHRAPRLETAVLAFVVLAGAYYSTLSIDAITRTSSLVHIVTNLIGVYLLVFTMRTYLRTRNPEGLLYFCMMGILLGVSVHDLVLVSGTSDQLWIRSFLMFNLGAPAVFVVLIIYLTWRLGRENVYWASRVETVTGQLASEFEVREALERDKATADERERIYRDLHDDIGARLLSMVYKAETPDQARAARQALRELRAIVSRSASPAAPLDETVSDWQREVRERTEEAGIELAWRQEISDGVLSAEAAYQLARMLRELVSNILKHAAATCISCSISGTPGALTIVVTDNGRGMSDAGHAGSGIAGIKHRIAELGGSAEWRNTGDGTTVEIRYHLNRGSNTTA